MSCSTFARYQGRHRDTRCGPTSTTGDVARLALTSTGVVLTGGLVLAAAAPATAHMPSPEGPQWRGTDLTKQSVLLRASAVAEGARSNVAGPWTPSQESRDERESRDEGSDADHWSNSEGDEQRERHRHRSSRGSGQHRHDDGQAGHVSHSAHRDDTEDRENSEGGSDDGSVDDYDQGREQDREQDHAHGRGDGGSGEASDARRSGRAGAREVAGVPVAPMPSKQANPAEGPEPSRPVTSAPEKRLTPKTTPTAQPKTTPTATPTSAPKAAPRVQPSATPNPQPSATPSSKSTVVPKPAPERNKAAPKPRATPVPKTAEQKASSGVVGIASGLQGIPYVWGGTSTKGFDCSGFTQHVYGKAGIDLPRTAAQQQRATKKVSDPKPGDLVFFGSPAYHVGVYAGEGRMYDAPRRGKTTGLRTIWSSNVTYGRAA